MPPLFHDLCFYLTHTLSRHEKTTLQDVIEANGGTVSRTPVPGSMHLVSNATLTATPSSEWVSIDFITDSLTCHTLQNPVDYTGFCSENKQHKNTDERKKRRQCYTLEDDARLLQFAIERGWKAMDAMPVSAWKKAETDRVTCHSASSMHEHFRKQLQRKTLSEQRSIMAKAAARQRASTVKQEAAAAAHEANDAQHMQSHSNVTADLGNVATIERTMSMQASRRTVNSAGCNRARTLHGVLGETDEEEKCSRRGARARSRKPASPVRISQRLRRSEEFEVPVASVTRSSPAMLVVPAAAEIPMVQANPASCAGTGNKSAGRKQQKRKHQAISNGAAVSHNSSLSHQGASGSDVDSVESKTSRDNGVFFRSTWTELTRDHAKRRMLQRFFESSSVPALEAQASSIGSAVTHPTDVVVSTAAQVGEGSQQVKTVEVATDKDTDQIICELQISTHQDMPTVIHAVYYCNGDAELAKTFLKGAVPSSMWSPEDDLLLVNLVAEEDIDRPAVDAAVARGDFASMQVPRDTDAILKRVQFLR